MLKCCSSPNSLSLLALKSQRSFCAVCHPPFRVSLHHALCLGIISATTCYLFDGMLLPLSAICLCICGALAISVTSDKPFTGGKCHSIPWGASVGLQARGFHALIVKTILDCLEAPIMTTAQTFIDLLSTNRNPQRYRRASRHHNFNLEFNWRL